MTKEVTRKEFIDISLLAGVGVGLLLISRRMAASEGNINSNERGLDNITEDRTWGEYRVGDAGLGQIQGMRVINADAELEAEILRKAKFERITNPKLAVIEIMGNKRDALVPLIWTTQNDRVLDRWSVWSINDLKEIVPVESKSDEGMVFVEMAKLNNGATQIIGPSKDNLVERYISYIQNWGWEMYLPYKDLDKVQGPIPLKQTANDLREFLTK